jgi:hypothetical protein
MPMLEGFRDMKSLWDPVNSTAIGQRRKHGFYPGSAPMMGSDLRPACLTFIDGVTTMVEYNGGVDAI